MEVISTRTTATTTTQSALVSHLQNHQTTVLTNFPAKENQKSSGDSAT
jgi:hypothetical protein